MPGGIGAIKEWFSRHRKITLIGAIVILLLLVIIAGFSSHSGNGTATNTSGSGSNGQKNGTKTYRFPNRPFKQPSDIEVAMNEPATVNDVKMTVNSVQYKSSLSGVEIAEPGQTYVIIDVTLENNGKLSQYYDAKDFKLQSAATRRTTDMTYATMANPLDYGDLAPGSKAEGQVTFLVPIDTDHQYILWQPAKAPVRAVAQIK